MAKIKATHRLRGPHGVIYDPKCHFLKGDDVSRIRQLFNMQIQNFFDNHLSIIRVEGNADTLIIFKKTVKPEDMRGFISEVSEIRNVFAIVKI